MFNYSLLDILNNWCIISPSSSISSNLAQNTWIGLISEAHQSHIPCAEDKALKGNKGQQKNLMHFTVYGTSFPQTPSFIPSVNHIREVWLFIHAHIFIMVERKYILKHAIKSTTFCLTEFIMMPDYKPGVWAVPCKGLPHWVHNCWKKRDIMYISKLQRAANQASRAVKSLNYLIKRNCWAALAGNDVLSQVFTPFLIQTLF